MKRKRAICPSFQSLEDRTALSFSFSSMVHSVLPFIPDKSNDAPKRPSGYVANARAEVHAAITAPRQNASPAPGQARAANVNAAAAARQARFAQAHAELGAGAGAVARPQRGVLNWFGPRPGQIRAALRANKPVG